MNKLIVITVLVSLAATAWGQSAPEAGDTTIEARVRAMLSMGVEETPGPRAWRLLGADAIDVLVATARDEEALPLFRVRAARALGHFPTDRTPGFLEELASVPSYGAGVRASALQALADLDVDRAVSQLEVALADEDGYMRRLAAGYLQHVLDARVGNLIRSAIEVEEVAHVRTALAKSLSQHERAMALRHTSKLDLTIVPSARDDLPAGVGEWVVTIRAPRVIDNADQLLRLEITATTGGALELEGEARWTTELQAGAEWTTTVRLRRTDESSILGFHLDVREAGQPLSAISARAIAD